MSRKTSIRDHKGIVVAKKMSRKVSSLSVERAWESVRLERYAELCRMVRFNRSMNDVFNVEESSELLSASSNRHAALCSALRSTLMIRPFLRVLRNLAVKNTLVLRSDG